MTAIVFMDTETTGLALDDDVWEFAAIRREPDGTEESLHLFIEHDTTKCAQLPELFLADHRARFPAGHTPDGAWNPEVNPRATAAHRIAAITGLSEDGSKPHIVGMVPNFDTERLSPLLYEHDLVSTWHYHLIDAETLAVGYLAGIDHSVGLPSVATLPWDSEELSRAVGVDPDRFARHTAMGDVLWTRAIYDQVMGVTN